MPLTIEQLQGKSLEELQALRQQLVQRKQELESPSKGILPQLGRGIGRGLQAGLKAFPSIALERKLPATKTATPTSDMNVFLQKERIKKLVGEEFEPTAEEEQRKREQKAVETIRTRAAFKGIGIAPDETVSGARQQVTAGVQEQAQVKRQQKIKDAVVKEQNKVTDVIGDIQIVEDDIESLLDTFIAIPKGQTGPISSILKAPSRFFQTEGTQEAVGYEDTKQFFLSNVARKLGGERGVLTDRDVERVEGLLPRLKDKDEIARGKIDKIKAFITRRIDEHKERVRTKVSRLKQGEGVDFGDIDTGLEGIFDDL